jgi:hypothetical protein
LEYKVESCKKNSSRIDKNGNLGEECELFCVNDGNS